jgi:hypothetical protein
MKNRQEVGPGSGDGCFRLEVQHRVGMACRGERPVSVQVRKGGPRDVEAVLALFDGAVRG